MRFSRNLRSLPNHTATPHRTPHHQHSVNPTTQSPGVTNPNVQNNMSGAFGFSGSLGYTSYPNPLSMGDPFHPDYINALVRDVQEIRASLAMLNVSGLLDRLEALQERIELLEDDIAS